MMKTILCVISAVICLLIATMTIAFLTFNLFNIFWWQVGLLFALMILSGVGAAGSIVWACEFYNMRGKG